MANFVNLTPHHINILIPGGRSTMRMILEPGKTIARLGGVSSEVDYIDGVPVRMWDPNLVEGVPPPQDDTFYITSAIVAEALKRPDVLSPDTSDASAVRDASGQITAVKYLRRWAKPAPSEAPEKTIARINLREMAKMGVLGPVDPIEAPAKPSPTRPDLSYTQADDELPEPLPFDEG